MKFEKFTKFNYEHERNFRLIKKKEKENENDILFWEFKQDDEATRPML